MNIVLVEPEIAPNTGNIARLATATGARLLLVKPFGFSLTDKALKRAGLDYWRSLDIKIYDSLEEFLSKAPKEKLFLFSTKVAKPFWDISYPNDAYLVFGPETRGLPKELLNRFSSHCLRIPMRKNSRSLNLSNSVAIAVYEVIRQRRQTTNFRLFIKD